MSKQTAFRTVYLRDATVTDFEETLQELGALRVRKNLDGWIWRFPARNNVAIELQVLENVSSWQMELTTENLLKWRAPFANEGWEPTIAATLQVDSTPEFTNVANALIQRILRVHLGVAGE